MAVLFLAWLQFRLYPAPRAYFVYCLAWLVVAVIATVRALVATMRRQPFAMQVGDWGVALLALSFVVDLFAITTLGHRVFWGWLPRLP